jgi:hypothetical protein
MCVIISWLEQIRILNCIRFPCLVVGTTVYRERPKLFCQAIGARPVFLMLRTSSGRRWQVQTRRRHSVEKYPALNESGHRRKKLDGGRSPAGKIS